MLLGSHFSSCTNRGQTRLLCCRLYFEILPGAQIHIETSSHDKFSVVPSPTSNIMPFISPRRLVFTVVAVAVRKAYSGSVPKDLQPHFK